MTAGGIVEPLDIVEHIRPGLVPGALDFARGALGLLRREEAFHRRMVPDVAGSAHAAKRRQPTEPSYRRSSASRPAGARLLFLPKYSPDLDPIDQFFAKLSTDSAKRHSSPPMPSVTLSVTS